MDAAERVANRAAGGAAALAGEESMQRVGHDEPSLTDEEACEPDSADESEDPLESESPTTRCAMPE